MVVGTDDATLVRAAQYGDLYARLVRHALLHGERGSTLIADAVVERIVLWAVAELHGVRLVSRRAITVAVGEHRVTLGLRVAIGYGPSLVEAAAALRAHVAARVEALTGLAVAAVDVDVVELEGEP